MNNDIDSVANSTAKKIIICSNHRSNPNNPSCGARGSANIALKLEQALCNHNMLIVVERFKCLGHCNKGPNLKISPNGRFFYGMTEEKITDVLNELNSAPF